LQRNVFSAVMAFVPLSDRPVPVRIGEEPEEARGDLVSGNFFSGLGIPAIRGRVFSPEDEQTHAPVAILSYGFWSRRFARDSTIVGQPFYVKGVPHTIVGIAAPGFIGLNRDKATDFWIPLTDHPDLKPWNTAASETRLTMYGSPHWFFLMLVGRLAPGVTAREALARIQPVYQRAAYEGLRVPESSARRSELFFTTAKGIEGLRQTYQTPLILLMSMVGVVLAIACANVAMLLLARNAVRTREFGVRLALGCSRWRLFSQLLSESLLLVAGGAGLGWWFSLYATAALGRWSSLDVSLAPDLRVLVFTIAMVVVVALIFAVVPLRGAMRTPMGVTLRSSVTTTPDRARRRLGQAVAAVQIAICLMLLVAAALLVRTMRNLDTANVGIRVPGLVVFGVSPAQSVHTDAEAAQFYDGLLSRLRSLPGVESATVLGNRPGSGWSNNTGVTVDGVNPLGTTFAPVRWTPVGPDPLSVLGTRVIAGRDITGRDTSAAPKVALVNETFVSRYLKNTTPLGHHIQLNGEDGVFAIVGVFADLKFTGVREASRPMAFVPFTQVTGTSSMTVEMRTNADPGSVLTQARRTLQDLGPDLTPLQPTTQRDQFGQSYSDDRLFSRLAMSFGALAVVLVATGLFGTLAYRVNRRAAEIGVRMALGAQRSQMTWMVFRETFAVVTLGIAAGLPLSIVAARLLRSMLFNVSPGDPISFVAALLGVASVAFVASAVPARRASAVDPMVALRVD
jgi:predicted permease